MLVVSLRRKAGDGLGELVVSNQTSLTLQLSRRIWRMQLGRCAPMVLEEKPSSSGKSDSDIPTSHMRHGDADAATKWNTFDYFNAVIYLYSTLTQLTGTR